MPSNHTQLDDDDDIRALGKRELAFAPPRSTTEMVEREPVTLESLARQLDRMLAELSSLRDDVNVLTAIVQRLDDSHTRLPRSALQTAKSLVTASGCAVLRNWRPATMRIAPLPKEIPE